MAIYSSILPWKIPWTEEPGRSQSMGPQGLTQLSTLLVLLSFTFRSVFSFELIFVKGVRSMSRFIFSTVVVLSLSRV